MIKFDYTKADGSVSPRMIIPTVVPNGNQKGIDVTDMDPMLAEVCASEYAAYLAEFNENIKKLMIKYDIEHNYRQFKTAGMSNVQNV